MDVLLVLLVIVGLVAIIALALISAFTLWLYLPPVVGFGCGLILSMSMHELRGNYMIAGLVIGLIGLYPWNAPKYAWREKIEMKVRRFWRH